MQVKLKVKLAGRFQKVCLPGDVVDLPEAEAQALLAAKLADPVPPAEPAT
jgi:hypothetical protein